jgi:hypothetical protein
LCVFSFGTRFIITSLISLPKDVSEVIMNPFMKKKHTMVEEPLEYRRSGCKIVYCYSCALSIGGRGRSGLPKKRL